MKQQNHNKVFSRQLLRDFLPNDAIILEAGAHKGTDTIKLAKLFPYGIIHAFEPVPFLFQELKKNCRAYENIFCYQYALSNTIGTQTMYVTYGTLSATSSLFKPQDILQEHSDITYHTITVATITIDAWASQHKINRIDFMWLDMQGGELDALKGAINILKTTHAILVEVNLTQRYAGIPRYQEIKEWLEIRNFSVYLEHMHHATWGNVLFLKK